MNHPKLNVGDLIIGRSFSTVNGRNVQNTEYYIYEGGLLSADVPDLIIDRFLNIDTNIGMAIPRADAIYFNFLPIKNAPKHITDKQNIWKMQRVLDK